MSIEIFVPDIGADEVEVTEVLVKAGDTVSLDQSLLSVEGDKAAMEVPAPQAGVVKEVRVKAGDKVKTGSLIMVFEGAAAASEAPAAAPVSAPAAAEATPAPAASTAATLQDVMVPDIGGDAVEVTEIMVKVGDVVKADQSLLNVEGDKAAMEVPAPFAGTVTEIKVKVGDKVSTGSLVFVFSTGAAAPAAAPAAQSAAPAAATTSAPVATAPAAPAPAATAASSGFVENQAYAHASPVVRRLAREFGVDLSKVTGSARKGRVQREDVQNYVKSIIAQVASGKGQVTGSGNSVGFDLIPWPKVDFAKFGAVEEKPLSRIQKLSGNNLHRNWVRIPHVT
ncbi:MAG: E3 binding domain-containing protein, partial [Gammaproteobacteria bacterium]|nr:E3 binding domain-containing protein [Gammaproteobacteria bacterium]